MRRITIALAACSAAFGCTTITEELPTTPPPIEVNGAPLTPPPAPLIVIPVPTATPEAPDPAVPPRAPAPGNPQPNPGGGGGGDQWIDNTNPAVRLGAKVFFLECNGREIPGSEGATSVDRGCRIHYDVTPKDANNAHTRVRETPRWTFSPASIAGGTGSSTQFTPTVNASGAGTLSAYCEADGIRSNTVTITIR
jgi:hypothetical protein